MYSTPIVPNPPLSPPASPRALPLGPSSCSFLSPLGHIFNKSVLIAIRRHAALPLHLPYSTYPSGCNCLAKLQLWFSLNFLKRNSHKTENLLFGTKSTLSKPHNFSATINFYPPPGWQAAPHQWCYFHQPPAPLPHTQPHCHPLSLLGLFLPQ